VILRLAVLVEHRLVTDGHRPTASTADALHSINKVAKAGGMYRFATNTAIQTCFISDVVVALWTSVDVVGVT